ncbi:unnamed protein product [Chrysoparadoxa australica]
MGLHWLVVAILSLKLTQAQLVSTQNLVDGDCVTTYDADTDYFPDKAFPDFDTTGFEVTYSNSYKTVTNNFVSPPAVYVLYQCGTPQPTVAGATSYFSVPLTSVGVGSTTMIPRFEQLGERKAIQSYITDTQYISSPCVNNLLLSGDIEEGFSDDFCDSGFATKRTNNTLLAEIGTQANFADGTSTDFCFDSQSETIDNLVQVLDYLVTGDIVLEVQTSRNSNLKYADWIKYFSYFFNREAQANAVYVDIKARISCTQTNAESCSDRLQRNPTVAWLPGYASWASPQAGWSVPRTDVYYHEFIASAGGSMVQCPPADADTYNYLTDEEFLTCFSAADVCIIGENYDDLAAVKGDVLDQLKCVTDERVFDTHKFGPNDWFESRQANPDVFLEDLVVAIHEDPEDFGVGEHTTVWLRDVNEDDVGVKGTDCPDPDAVLESEADECVDVGNCASAASWLSPSKATATVFAALVAVLGML